MDKNEGWGYLKTLTKSQIIEFLKQNYSLRDPSKRDVDFFKADTLTRENLKKADEHARSIDTIAIARRMDELAVEFNSSDDSEEKLKIIKKMVPMRDKIAEYHEKQNQFQKKWEKIQKIYPDDYA